MRVIALEYHDVVHPGARDASGFPGGPAGSYKLDVSDFQAHLRALDGVANRATVHDLDPADSDDVPVLLTFDDGGCSAHSEIAGRLEAAGWRGHFFITTDRIGRPGFLSPPQVRDLHRRGHIIGSHSCSHPARMATAAWPELVREWGTSVGDLADLLGAPVTSASVPNGSVSRRVIQAAASTGIRTMFTSEPVTRTTIIAGCLVIGRFTLRSATPPWVAAQLAGGCRLPRIRQWVLWNGKAVIKRATGSVYESVRQRLLDGRRG